MHGKNKIRFLCREGKKEGFEHIYRTFKTIADNERAHAYVWYRLLKNAVGTTAQNLAEASDGEYTEWSQMYKGFAAEAKEEGFDEIAAKFEKPQT